MKLFRHVRCLGLIFTILALGIATPSNGAPDQSAQANWDNLNSIPRGDVVMVVLNGAQSMQGKFETFTDDSITLQTPSGGQSFKRENVIRVSTRGQKHRGRHVLIGASIGAGAGLGIGILADRQPSCGPSGPFFCGSLFSNLGKEIITPLGAVVGAIVGLVIPSGRWHEVYRAR